MTLPYAAVVASLRTAASEAGRIRVDLLAPRLHSAQAESMEQAAAAFSRLVTGWAADAPTAPRETALALASMSAGPRALACALGPALVASDQAAVVGRALLAICVACGAAIGAVVPAAAAIDATLLEACRGVSWAPERLRKKAGADRAEELARRVARALGVTVETATQVESAEVSRARLQRLDLELATAIARSAEIEKKVRASLPKV